MNNWKPMLATNIKPNQINLPAMGSVKLEGVRGCFTPEGLRTRPMKKFGNPWLEMRFQKLIDLCEENNLVVEGEFYKHGIPFNQISSITRKRHHEDTDELDFHIFDVYDHNIPNMKFEDRYKIAQNVCFILGNPRYQVIEQIMHESVEEIEACYADAIENDYEGWCLKDPAGMYKAGRSTVTEQLFVRMKAENTYDGVVLDIVERLENLCESETNELGYQSKRQDKDMKAETGMAAVAITKCAEFDKEIRVTLSRGLTDADRAEIWDNKENYIGKHIRFVGIPVRGMLPRAPRFDDWRTDLD